MALAFVVPLLPVPQQMSFRKIPAQAVSVSADVTAVQNTSVQSPEKNVPALIDRAEKNSPINFQQVMQWAVYLYWFGVILFALNFLMQAGVLLYKAYSKPVINDGPFRIVEISGDKAPCSFGNNIFINPEKYDWETYSQVLLHEKIHIEQKHTLDLLLAEIVLIFQWFNPFAWQWRKELENNLEFFTDDTLLQQDAVEKESYQLSLLKVAAPHFPLSLTTNYNQSLLKKRLLMMNAKKSNVHTIWKYFFLLPLMVLFVCLFNEPIVNSQTLSSKSKPAAHPQHDHGMKTAGSWFATIKEDKVSMQFKSDDDDKSNNNNTFLISEFSNLPKGSQGSFTLTREAGTMEFTGKFEGDNGMGKYKFVPNKTYSDAMQKEGIGINQDDDALVFFFLKIKLSYVQMLKKNGYNELDKDKLIPLAALDVSEAYITSINEAGFKDISLDNLVPFKALNIDKVYIEEIRKAGYKNLDPEKVITFKAQGIDGKYIADFRSSTKAGQPDNSKEDDADAIIDNANKNNNRNKSSDKNSNSKEDDGYDDFIAFKSLNIDTDFINSFKAVGYNNLSNSDLIAMKSLGVTPGYVQEFNKAGFNNIKPDDLVALKSQNVTPALVRNYKDLGFDNVSLQDVIGASATGTSPSFIQSMRDKGHKMKSLDKYIALKAVLGN
jgi:hypothetical protein